MDPLFEVKFVSWRVINIIKVIGHKSFFGQGDGADG